MAHFPGEISDLAASAPLTSRPHFPVQSSATRPGLARKLESTRTWPPSNPSVPRPGPLRPSVRLSPLPLPARPTPPWAGRPGHPAITFGKGPCGSAWQRTLCARRFLLVEGRGRARGLRQPSSGHDLGSEAARVATSLPCTRSRARARPAVVARLAPPSRVPRSRREPRLAAAAGTARPRRRRQRGRGRRRPVRPGAPQGRRRRSRAARCARGRIRREEAQ
jgi:hypothetical protein